MIIPDLAQLQLAMPKVSLVAACGLGNQGITSSQWLNPGGAYDDRMRYVTLISVLQNV